MHSELHLRRFIQAAESHLGRPYIWGGDDPSGFDCSGLVVECLKSIGAIKQKSDYTADGLWRLFRHEFEESKARQGSMAFYFKHNRAFHIVICLDNEFYIGAEGGGSKVQDIKTAHKANAFIKIRPLSIRTGETKFINIFE